MKRILCLHLQLFLQLGSSGDVFFIVLLGVALAAIALIVFIYSIRGTSAISDEFSSGVKPKLDALIPNDTGIKSSSAQPPSPTVPSTQGIRAALSEKEKLHAEIASLTADVRSLTGRFQDNDQELQKLRKILEEQDAKLHVQEQRDSDNRRTIGDLRMVIMKSMSQPNLCLNCQRPLNITDRFCDRCGSPTSQAPVKSP
jgi:TolA-binding protein